jgi:hypothetical protein
MSLNESTNDLVTWSNVRFPTWPCLGPRSHPPVAQDIFSYNVEQSRGDTHNMIVILMQQQGHTLQSAVDFVGDLCEHSIKSFSSNREKIPSWGPEIDDMVRRYVQGLQDWIVGYVCTVFCHDECN